MLPLELVAATQLRLEPLDRLRLRAHSVDPPVDRYYLNQMTLRVGLIGTGWVADKHLSALAKTEASVVAIAGRNQGVTRELAARVGAQAFAFDDCAQMLRSQALDAVYVCLPPHLHGEIERQCAEHVPAVFIEKPVSCNLNVARRCAEVFAKAGTLVSVGFMGRYRASVEHAKRALVEAAEPVVLVNGAWVGDMPGPLWWRTQTQSGGQFVEQCTHLVDLARYLVGEIAEVSAFSASGFVRDVPGYSVNDAEVVNVRFESGAIGNFTTGCFVRPGAASALGISLALATRTVQCSFKDWQLDLELQLGNDVVTHVRSVEPDIFAVESSAFIHAIQRNDPKLVRSSYADAIETLKVGLAATRSVAERRPVAPSSL